MPEGGATVSPVLVEVWRGELIESRHRGVLAALRPDGSAAISLGRVDAPVYPRSCAKPLQLAAMLRAGLDQLSLDDEQLAVAAASHSGQTKHTEQVLRILAAAGLTVEALDNTPGWPIDTIARNALIRSGGVADRLHQNCSGKHAAMLATCVAAGWPTATYRSPDHPLQLAIREHIGALAGEPVTATTIDGCGAPLFAITIAGLARAFLRLAGSAPATAEHAVVTAMRARPDLVGGDGRDVTALLSVPGVVAKDGAEGVYAAAALELGAVALKIDDGASRGRAPAMVAALRWLGADGEALARVPIEPVLGHGQPVGELLPAAALTAD